MKRLITLQVFAISLLFLLPLSSRAEYYMVYPGGGYYTTAYTGCGSCCKRVCYKRCNTCCRNPCGSSYYGYYGYSNDYYYESPPVVYLNYVSPMRRPAYRGSEELAEYAWVPYP